MELETGYNPYRCVKLPFFFLIPLFFLIACSPTKKLADNEFLVEKNIIADKASGLDKELIESYIRQKPNRKLFRLFYFHTWLYNTVNQRKDSLKKIERNKKYLKINTRRTDKVREENRRRHEKRDKKNLERIAKGKSPIRARKDNQAKLKNLEDLTFGEKIREIGEEAVVLDTFYTRVSTEQIRKFMHNNGFFNAQVKDSVVYNPSKSRRKQKRAHVYYIIRAGVPYHIRSVKYKIDDPMVETQVLKDTASCKIKPGNRYEGDALGAERERIYKFLINHGYYEFSQEFIYFLVDTNLNSSKKMDITIGIKKFTYKEETNGKDTILSRNHTRFYIRNVYAITDYNPYVKTIYKDTTAFEKSGTVYYFLHNGKMQFRKSVMANLITIAPGQLYSYEVAEETYRRLSDLKAFRNINVVFNLVPGTTDQLDVVLQMSPVMRQAFTAEAEGTNTSGNLGVAGSLIYQNRNVGHGAELMEVKLKGGLTAQKNFGVQADPNIGKGNIFNTAQFGPEFNLYFPRMFFPLSFKMLHWMIPGSVRIFRWGKDASPKTIFTSSANYQQRPEFARTLINLSYGFQWKWREYHRFNFMPCEASVVKVAKTTEAFENQLAASNDFFLKNSFIDHITVDSRISWTYNNQNKPSLLKPVPKPLTYLKVSIESAGNLLRELYTWTDRPKDANGRYTIAGTPFAHYWKGDIDWRLYIPIRESQTNRLVLRAYAGAGIARINLPVLPYEKSFFGGGPNSVRAWKARTLGPGAYEDVVNVNFDKLGDIQLEGNIEYRFNLYKMLNGALFTDFGNIWLRQKDDSKPKAHFDLDRFYREIAMGVGAGIRADFSFFIIRLDASFKLYDPKAPLGDRWTFQRHPQTETVFNFGIGYPF